VTVPNTLKSWKLWRQIRKVRLVIHRQWITDPDGNEYADRVIEKSYKDILYRNEERLVRAMKQMGFSLVPAMVRDFASDLSCGVLH
jgi:hypothetical protein